MDGAEEILETISNIVSISNDGQLGFEQKLHCILEETMKCTGMAKGSIMLVKGRKSLEVAASSMPELVGVRQSLEDEDSPSAWVVKNKKPLYVERRTDSSFPNKFDHYRKNAFFSVPLISGKKVIGVLNLTEKVVLDLLLESEQDQVLNIAGYFIMAIENQRANEAIKKSRSSIRKKNEQLKKMEKAKDQLFNMLVHDLKGPISEMVANLDLLSYTVKDENLDYVQSAQAACDSLYRMVADMLEITRIEEGSLKLFLQHIDPEELIEDSLAGVSGMGAIKEIRFSRAIPEDLDGRMFAGDRNILSRVLQNLLVNAISYTETGGGVILGCCFPKPGKIEFFVEDEGPGIPDGFEEKIFDKFVRIERQDVQRSYSTGLGLTFCRMAVQAHKGVITARNARPIGARFSFTLPLGF